MKHSSSAVIVLLGLVGLLGWQQDLQFARNWSWRPCEISGVGSDVTVGTTKRSNNEYKNETLILELQRAQSRINHLEREISRLKEGQQDQTTKQQRIALLFTGAPRTLTQLGVMTSHVVNVIDALSAGGRDVVDVYFHLNNGTTDSFHASHNMRRVPQKPFTQANLETLINLTSPVEVILHKDSGCSGLDGRIVNHSCCTFSWARNQTLWLYNFLQYAFVRESYRRAKEYERVNNVEYDWFVRMRPDVACFEPMPAARSLSTRRFYLLTKERELGGNTNDYVFVVPKKLSHSFFEQQIMTIFDTSCSKGISRWPSEGTMFLSWPKLPYQVFPFPCVHVLSPNAAECFRLSRVRQRSIPSVYDVDGSMFGRGQTFEEGCNELVKNGYFGEQTYVDGEDMETTWRR